MNIKVISFILEKSDLPYYEILKESFSKNSEHIYNFISLETSDYLEAFSFLDTEVKKKDSDLVIIADPYSRIIKPIDETINEFLESNTSLGGTTNVGLYLETFVCDTNYKTADIIFLNSQFCFINPNLYTNEYTLDDVQIDNDDLLYHNITLILNIVNSEFLYMPVLMCKDTSTLLNYDNVKVVCFREFDYECLYPFDVFGEFLDDKKYKDKIDKFGKEFIINTYKKNTIISVIGTENCKLQNIKHLS